MNQTSLMCFRAWILVCLLAPRLLGLTINGELTRHGVHRADIDIVPFKVTLSQDLQLWQITVLCTNREIICGTDGQKTCFIRKWSQEALKAGGVPHGIPQATIVNGVFPGVSDIEDRMVWLAFASSSFFAVQTNPMVCLWRGGSGLDTPTDYGVKIYKIEFLNSGGRIPETVDFTFSSDQLLNLTNFAFLPFKERDPSRFHDAVMANKQHEGELIAEYSTKGVTNYNGLSLPLEFELNLSGWIIFDGKVVSVTSDTPDSFLPDVKESLYATDYRFTDRKSMTDSITYTMTNQDWPSTNDPALQALFEHEKQKLPPGHGKRIAGNAKQMTVIFERTILLLIMLSLPVILYSYLKQKNT